MPMDLVGDTYGRGTVLREAESQIRPDNGQRRRMWAMECACGNFYTARHDQIRNGTSTSCGCWHREVAARPRRGSVSNYRNPEARALYNARQRCSNPSDPRWGDYGGRGITVADYWQGEEGMRRFLEYVGSRPEGTSIDRIDNDGNYEEGNMRWATDAEQAANKRVP